MGASFNAVTYDGKLTKKEVEKLWNGSVQESLHESGHSYSGRIGMLGNGINWDTMEFPTENEAHEYLSNKQEKWDKAMGVKYTKLNGEKMWLVGGWCSE